MERCGGVGWRKAAAAAGEDGKGAGDLGADGVDGADVEAVGMIEENPAELPVALEDGEGEGAGLEVEAVGSGRGGVEAGCFKMREHAVP